LPRPDLSLKYVSSIDILTGEHSRRWLYFEGGYVTILSKKQKPIYIIKNQNEFNKLIGQTIATNTSEE
jgi:hypothetical protein